MSDYDPIKLAQARDEERGRERIAELTRQRDIESAEGDKLRERTAELERELAAAIQAVFHMARLAKENAAFYAEKFPEPNRVGAMKAYADTMTAELEDRLNAGLKERDSLRLQVARLREALTVVQQIAYGEIDTGSDVNAINQAGTIADKALAETPPQAAKEVLGEAVQLLETVLDLRKFTTEVFHRIEKEITRLKRLWE